MEWVVEFDGSDEGTNSGGGHHMVKEHGAGVSLVMMSQEIKDELISEEGGTSHGSVSADDVLQHSIKREGVKTKINLY